MLVSTLLNKKFASLCSILAVLDSIESNLSIGWRVGVRVDSIESTLALT
ncbi:hypothetical protein DCO58_12160 [Helicobacter saguini]|uniref:Uncharacterized protein n=1 Tax=Helicobacter saguini TaxID=1548018 RepID=A0A6B0HNX2_9HELI|nr:hypothetical protein [Helicobacter saguini]MWV60957.1 hypothetical protein [Helicobacter saguini]MWV68375.1 hypothetical protein [Helicobacter saguini]MWV70161.1 hypothetical protein [Helicobacter saguini]MWV72064.1 hypothetical protein [Helicobacter saguini]